jgi:DNA-binding beta-propeller fold protein YncE
MSVGASSVSLQLIPNTNGSIFPYALGIDPENNQIYLGDAKGFSSSGQVKVYSKDGQLLESFSTGVGPNAFVFRK